MRTSGKFSFLLASAVLAGILSQPSPARAAEVVYDLLAPEAAALDGLASAVYEVAGPSRGDPRLCAAISRWLGLSRPPGLLSKPV